MVSDKVQQPISNLIVWLFLLTGFESAILGEYWGRRGEPLGILVPLSFLVPFAVAFLVGIWSVYIRPSEPVSRNVNIGRAPRYLVSTAAMVLTVWTARLTWLGIRKELPPGYHHLPDLVILPIFAVFLILPGISVWISAKYSWGPQNLPGKPRPTGLGKVFVYVLTLETLASTLLYAVVGGDGIRSTDMDSPKSLLGGLCIALVETGLGMVLVLNLRRTRSKFLLWVSLVPCAVLLVLTSIEFWFRTGNG